MPILTTVVCDQCKKRIEIGEADSEDAAYILQVTDANAAKTFFCGINCLRQWAIKYDSPYKRPQAADYIPVDAILPEGKTN